MKKKSEKRLVGDRDGHVLEFEYVPTAEKAREMYVVYDGSGLPIGVNPAPQKRAGGYQWSRVSRLLTLARTITR
jgi:hypothetical protein